MTGVVFSSNLGVASISTLKARINLVEIDSLGRNGETESASTIIFAFLGEGARIGTFGLSFIFGFTDPNGRREEGLAGSYARSRASLFHIRVLRWMDNVFHISSGIRAVRSIVVIWWFPPFLSSPVNVTAVLVETVAWTPTLVQIVCFFCQPFMISGSINWSCKSLQSISDGSWLELAGDFLLISSWRALCVFRMALRSPSASSIDSNFDIFCLADLRLCFNTPFSKLMANIVCLRSSICCCISRRKRM